MSILLPILTVVGLIVFEVVSSVDNAIINAKVLATMGDRMRRWFLFWGLLLAVFLVRGLLPWLIVWGAMPGLGPWGALTATFSSDPKVLQAVNDQKPLLLVGGGIFLVLLFLNWIFLEDKEYAWPRLERFCAARAVWFYAIASTLLTVLIYEAVAHEHPWMAFSAALGSSAYFLCHGFRQTAEKAEEAMVEGRSGMSDLSKVIYLEVIDATFSIDGVLGAFAFTLSVPLILLGNGIGAWVLRELTVRNIERIARYRYLGNGAMYSIAVLGTVMLLESFHIEVPEWVSPVATVGIILYFLRLSIRANKKAETAA